MQSDEWPPAGRLEDSVWRARRLLGPAAASRNLESAEGDGGNMRSGPPDEQDQQNIAAKLRAARGNRPPVIAGQSPDDDADALAAQIVSRAQAMLSALREGASWGTVSEADAAAFEAVLQVRGRPALRVEQRLETIDDEKHPGSAFWRPFFNEHELRLVEVASAAGAVVAKDKSGKPPWVQGTAWLVAHDLVLTNRHVLFPPPNGIALARRVSGAATTARFRTDMEVRIDFAHDNGPSRNMVYAVEDIPFVSEEEDPVDVALIRVKPTPTQSCPMPRPLSLANDGLTSSYVYVVGHPGAVSKVPASVMAVFGTPDERKRVSFGEVMKGSAQPERELLHDASTIGGYSGGCVLAFGSEAVAALHYYGHPLSGNRAFTAAALRSHAVSQFF